MLEFAVKASGLRGRISAPATCYQHATGTCHKRTLTGGATVTAPDDTTPLFRFAFGVS